MSFKKASARGRLDKYYKLAKERGYRARSAFKLLQLNEKFKFLEKSRVLIDLCAAPGGWLQVASENMPVSHIIIGVDLDHIKPLKGVTTLRCDITSARCKSELEKELKSWKADVILHDGAPNVGSSWDKDSHNQNDLVVASLRLASHFLRVGGVFVTKVFRSIDYQNLLCLFGKIFDKVDSTKPASSRNVSAEIFVVCRGFKGLSKFSPEILEPKNVFCDNSLNVQKKTCIFSREIKNRSGYEEGQTLLYKEINLSELLDCQDLEPSLCSVNKITISEEEIKRYKIDDLHSLEFAAYLDDLKLAPKKELMKILKWLKKIKKAELKVPEVEVSKLPPSADDLETILEDEVKRSVRTQKKRDKKLSERKNKQKLSAEISIEDSEHNEWFVNNVTSRIVDETPELHSDRTIQPTRKERVPSPNSRAVFSGLMKSKEDIIDDSYNRYSKTDEELPDWFLEDEKIHSKRWEVLDNLAPPSKATRSLPKKAIEAKLRNKMKATKKLDSLKKKAAILENSDRLEDVEKLRTILKNFYKKQTRNRMRKPIIAKGKLKGCSGRPRGVRGRYVMLDKRMKKDKRN